MAFLFDQSISPDIKRKIVTALTREKNLDEQENRFKINDIEEIKDKEILDFIYSGTYTFFKRFKTFLQIF